ncbi:MAG: RelA/SpoT domain-containing protein [Alphaproteobacteria bacterium]|nr:RelA/SpoT domain-containing protein [Alphaproteobacteria bacterium]
MHASFAAEVQLETGRAAKKNDYCSCTALMNFDEYEKTKMALYREMADTVRRILERAIEAGGLPRPQSIQFRCKTPQSLKKRLEESGDLARDDIETLRRDLAGVRLIFYTNTDVDQFLNSRVIFENFEPEKGSTKLHHPTKENDGVRYRAVHYTVRLADDRAKLAEYSHLAGLRCEIQIQTILNHAWSETTHDILYKSDRSPGFGKDEMATLENRMNDVMDKYLLRAGYEIQRVQHDYVRLMQGKALFDRDAIVALRHATNNNERFEILTTLKDGALPQYDDLPAIYGDLQQPLVEAAKAARHAAVETIKTTYGDLPGHTAEEIGKFVVEIFNYMRLVDLRATLDCLMDIYSGEPSEVVRKEILETAKRLSEFDLKIYRNYGVSVQLELLNFLKEQPVERLDRAFEVVLTVWREALQSDVSGTTWSADAVTFSTGAISVDETLKDVRRLAIEALFDAYDRAETDSRRLEILNALDAATHTPSQAQYSNALLALSLQDTRQIVEFVTARADALSYEMKQYLENQFHSDFERASQIASVDGDRFESRDAAELLKTAILTFRDRINADPHFVRYKALVGYNSIYPPHWEDTEFDYQGADEYRKDVADSFVGEINDGNKADWLKFLERCAATKSNDMATFPAFSTFLVKLAASKPDIAEYFVINGNGDILGFLAAFLAGLHESQSLEIYNRVIDREIERGANLWALARHWRNAKPDDPARLMRVFRLAVEKDEWMAVAECLVFSLENWGAPLCPPVERMFRPALNYLNGRQEWRWLNNAWFLKTLGPAFDAMSITDIDLMLENLMFAPKISYHEETILGLIARSHVRSVWEFFGRRLLRERVDGEEPRYAAVPYSFHGLEKELCKDAATALSVIRPLFDQDKRLFRFRGGRLISSAFPGCPETLSRELSRLVREGWPDDTDFVLRILANYKDTNGMDAVLRDIVARYPQDEDKLTGVSVAFDTTGVVMGEFGMADAYRGKKRAMEAWLVDPRPEVQAFARLHISELDLRIISEQKRAEDSVEMRKLRFDGPDEDGEGE